MADTATLIGRLISDADRLAQATETLITRQEPQARIAASNAALRVRATITEIKTALASKGFKWVAP